MKVINLTKPISLMLCILLFAGSLPVFSQTKPDGKGVGVKPVSQLPSNEKRWALIIGIDDYQDDNIADLRGAANDAKTLAESLEKYAGFPTDQIILLGTNEPKVRQPTRSNILKRLSILKGLVPKDGLLLVSFSGHGIERGNSAFLIPSDATSTDDVDLLENTALSVETIKRQVKATQVRQVLFLLDACRNDPTSGRSETNNPLTDAYKKGFSFDVANQEVEAFATIYATSVGARAYEYNEKRQGYFSWAIVEALSGKAANSNGEITLGSLVKYLENRVPKLVAIDLGASKVQKPFAVIEGYKADELVLAIGNTIAQPIPQPLPTPNSDTRNGEDIFWAEVSKLNTKSAYQNYLNDYPNGKYISTATLRIKNIEEADSNLFSRWDKMLNFSQEDIIISETTAELSKNPDNVIALRMRSNAYYAKNKNSDEAGKADAEAVLRLIKNPKSAEEYESICHSYRRLEKTEEGITACTKAIELNANFYSAFRNRGNLYLNKENYDQAIKDFNKAIQIHPDYSITYSNRGVVYNNKKDYDQAIQDYTKAIQLNPNDAATYYNRGNAYYNKQNYDQAIQDYTKAIQLNPNDAYAYLNRGDIFHNIKKYYDSAIKDYSKAIELNPAFANAYNNRGNAHLNKKEFDLAIQDFNKAIQLNPSFNAYYNRGFAYDNKQNYDQAIQDYTKAIQLDPNYSLAYYNRGIAYDNKQNYDLAIQDYNKAIQLNPNYAGAYNNRGLAYAKNSDYDQAIQDYSKAIQLDPNESLAYNNRGNAYANKQNYDQAIQDYTKAIQINPNYAIFYRNRAIIYDQLGETSKAKADRKKADELEKKP
jgi:tetratricopeptide (TPR) repeat protein